MNSPVIETCDLTKHFGAAEVLRGVNLAIPEGSVVGLLGVNGSGKTTLIQCLTGLLRVTSGTARMFGEDVWDLSAQTKSRLACVSQTPTFYAWMNVRQMIDYTSAFYDTWDAARCDRLVQQLDLDLSRKVSTLSVGQQQRLALVLAMGHDPELLLLDEPAASLDPQGRRELLRTLLDSPHDHSRTVLFSTHITSDLERVASHVAILRGGVIDYFGPLDDLKESVKRLRITWPDAVPGGFCVPNALRTDAEGRTVVAAVSNADGDLPQRLAAEWNADVQIEDLNLEDIFLELHHD